MSAGREPLHQHTWTDAGYAAGTQMARAPATKIARQFGHEARPRLPLAKTWCGYVLSDEQKRWFHPKD
uniref:Transposase n=1 Tax=Angiostrongylus cantonensis TaxID=6313 RepID=A0A0K0CZH3_ANGCA